MTRSIEPGATIGVLGSGQLGRMFTLAAHRLGYRVHIFSPQRDSPAGQVADSEIEAAYDDADAIAEFARHVDVVTYEFENIPAETVNIIQRHAPVRPGPNALATTQNRLREKTFLRAAGFPVPEFCVIRSRADLQSAMARRHPAVIKTAAWGYDGKGQMKLDRDANVDSVWKAMPSQEAIFEQFVDFQMELSVVAARGLDGRFAPYQPIQNLHRHHILDLSITPIDLPGGIADEAVDMAQAILSQLEAVGVLCVEFFLTRDGQLLVNEIAPRPHNSGHLTLDAHATCQFEQQVRAICGLPLGDCQQHRPAAMANLLGECWEGGQPNWLAALADPAVKLHLYGKETPRRGRKMGHLTALADSPEAAADRVLAARQRLLATPPKKSSDLVIAAHS